MYTYIIQSLIHAFIHSFSTLRSSTDSLIPIQTTSLMPKEHISETLGCSSYYYS